MHVSRVDTPFSSNRFDRYANTFPLSSLLSIPNPPPPSPSADDEDVSVAAEAVGFDPTDPGVVPLADRIAMALSSMIENSGALGSLRAEPRSCQRFSITGKPSGLSSEKQSLIDAEDGV
jgi:hypothetical protein